MNYWYVPTLDASPQTPAVPPELIEAVAAPWRSTAELEALRAKAKQLAHYDLADAAHRKLQSRKRQEAKGTLQALQQGQTKQQQALDAAALDTISTVDAIWSQQLQRLRQEADAAVRALQERHEDALHKLRLDQVARAHETGIRPQRRNKDLQNLRRSESVLAASNNFRAASRVKAHADQLSAAEASEAHAGWLLRCHGEQERLLAQQRRELEALRKRVNSRLREVEAARDRDLAGLGRKITVGIARQQQLFAKERQHLEAALGGCLLNTRSTRIGGALEHSFPTLAMLASPRAAAGGMQAAAARPYSAPRAPATPTHGSQPRSACSGSAASSGDTARVRGGHEAQGVHFAPTPPREAWGSDASSSGSSNSSRGSRSSQRPSTSSASGDSGIKGSGAGDCASNPWQLSPPTGANHFNRAVIETHQGSAVRGEVGDKAPPSTAVGSGTTGNATGSGSTALTEATLRAMDKAMGARPSVQRGASSLETSSFKSNRPYAGGPHVQGALRSGHR